MSKIQNTASKRIVSEWEGTWDKEKYESHTRDFEVIRDEIKYLTGNLPKRIMWLVKKGVLRTFDYMGNVDWKVISDDYSKYDAMWSKFGDWVAFNERKNNVPLPPMPTMIIKSIASERSI